MSDIGDFVIQEGTLVRYRGPGGDVVIPPGAVRIGREAFLDCPGLTGVSVPAGATEIGPLAFANCVNLARVDLPESLEEIGAHAFFRCGALTELILPAGVTRVGNSAFSRCSGLTGVSVPAGVTEIGALTFANCASLARVDLPQGLTEIGDLAFFRCDALTDITLPAGATRIGKKAFACCANLSVVALPSSATQIDKTAFYGSDPAVAAPHIPLGEFSKMDKPKIIRGFAAAYFRSMPIEETDRIRYLAYIRRQRKRLYPLALQHEEVLRLMIAEAIIPPRDIQPLLDEAERRQNGAAQALILEYGRKI